MKKYIHVFSDIHCPAKKLYFLRLYHKRYYAYKESLKDVYSLCKQWNKVYLGSYQPTSLKALMEDMRICEYKYEGKIVF